MAAEFDAEHIPPGAKLELYISPSCPYCKSAMAYYDSLGVSYAVHDAQNDRRERERMLRYTSGDPTVPAIVVDGAYLQSGWGSPLRG
ncbi:MAG TPA: glutaredoxin [Candidatus Cybelea sp.]|jgi:glutaredoxin 3|nr:glutaredoxin [Candidatus Cybelea sp.]